MLKEGSLKGEPQDSFLPWPKWMCPPPFCRVQASPAEEPVTIGRLARGVTLPHLKRINLNYREKAKWLMSWEA